MSKEHQNVGRGDVAEQTLGRQVHAVVTRRSSTFADRSGTLEIVDAMLTEGRPNRLPENKNQVAIDSTGLEDDFDQRLLSDPEQPAADAGVARQITGF